MTGLGEGDRIRGIDVDVFSALILRQEGEAQVLASHLNVAAALAEITIERLRGGGGLVLVKRVFGREDLSHGWSGQGDDRKRCGCGECANHST